MTAGTAHCDSIASGGGYHLDSLLKLAAVLHDQIPSIAGAASTLYLSALKHAVVGRQMWQSERLLWGWPTDWLTGTGG